MQIQEPENCTKVELELEGKPQPSSTVVRNRRFRKMKQLQEEGFFSEDAIKLRHPLLYHTYLQGHHQRPTQQTPNCTLSQFLEKNLINLEYRRRLAEEMGKNIEDEKDEHSEEGWQLLQEVNGEVSMDKQGVERRGMHEKGIIKSWDVVEEEEIELEEQNLIDHAEQLYLTGQVDKAFIDYNQIDCNSAYDDENEEEEEARAAEEKYLVGSGDEEEDSSINLQHYTGIQDY